MKKYIKHKIIKPLLGFLRQGMSVEKMSLTLALGICFGIMPFFGITTYLLAFIAIILKLNIPAIQFVNYAVYAFQVVLYVPFLKFSQIIFFPNNLNYQFNNIIGLYQTDFMGTLKAFWHLNLGAVIIWAIVAIPLGIAIYYFSQPFIMKQKLKLSTVKVPNKNQSFSNN